MNKEVSHQGGRVAAHYPGGRDTLSETDEVPKLCMILCLKGFRFLGTSCFFHYWRCFQWNMKLLTNF